MPSHHDETTASKAHSVVKKPTMNVHEASVEVVSDTVRCALLAVADPQERDYRAATLSNIERSVQKQGPHVSQPHESRARQFMPFAALKGYADMIQEATTQ